ncbi:MAG TPA: hypothetical protein VGF84_05190, partial [Micromonosporaceae bacterium]
ATARLGCRSELTKRRSGNMPDGAPQCHRARIVELAAPPGTESDPSRPAGRPRRHLRLRGLVQIRTGILTGTAESR